MNRSQSFFSQIFIALIFFISIVFQRCNVSSEPAHRVLADTPHVSNEILDAEYKKAIQANKVQTYNQFIKKYPYAPQIQDVRAKRNALDTTKKDKTFKVLQLRNKNPKTAFVEKEEIVKKMLTEKNIDYETFEVLLRVIKSEQIMELWVKDRRDNDKFILLKTYNLCISKNRDGLRGTELLVPESFYHISKFHPGDPYFLRMETNFPNESDRIRGRTGGDVAIHGGCFSTYCTPFTDEDIKEIYVLAVEAKSKGEKMVLVHNFPARMDDVNFKKLINDPLYADNAKKIAYWTNMKEVYDYFEKNRTIPKIKIEKKTGKYLISEE